MDFTDRNNDGHEAIFNGQDLKVLYFVAKSNNQSLFMHRWSNNSENQRRAKS